MASLDTLQHTIYSTGKTSHYYGNIVRILFLTTGGFMLFFTPFFTNEIPVPYILALFIALSLGIISGLINPIQRWVSILNLFVAGLGTLFLGYYAVGSYVKYSALNFFFWANQILTIIFFIAFYYSLKTFRGFYFQNERR